MKIILLSVVLMVLATTRMTNADDDDDDAEDDDDCISLKDQLERLSQYQDVMIKIYKSIAQHPGWKDLIGGWALETKDGREDVNYYMDPDYLYTADNIRENVLPHYVKDACDPYEEVTDEMIERIILEVKKIYLNIKEDLLRNELDMKPIIEALVNPDSIPPEMRMTNASPDDCISLKPQLERLSQYQDMMLPIYKSITQHPGWKDPIFRGWKDLIEEWAEESADGRVDSTSGLHSSEENYEGYTADNIRKNKLPRFVKDVCDPYEGVTDEMIERIILEVKKIYINIKYDLGGNEGGFTRIIEALEEVNPDSIAPEPFHPLESYL